MLHIVDDEDVIRDSLIWLAHSRHILAAGYGSAQAFLSAIDAGAPPDPQGQCLLLDVRMPDMSGTLLFDTLSARGLTQCMPVIFLTGHGDVPMAVQSLKRGAFDFFEKPFNNNALMDRVQEAMLASCQAVDRAQVTARVATLSAREREVMDLMLDGKMNKVIADMMGISMRTVEVHRARVFDKMRVRTAVELARLLK
jgi:two-component system response regulator DctR